MIVFQTVLPSYGPGALKNRDEMKILGTDQEKSLYEPQEFYWRKLGQDCASNGVCVDMFLFPSTYVDVATIGMLLNCNIQDVFQLYLAVIFSFILVLTQLEME